MNTCIKVDVGAALEESCGVVRMKTLDIEITLKPLSV